MTEQDDDVRARSEQVLAAFESFKGQPLGEIADFPVPPFTQWLNGKIISAARGALELEYIVRPEMANPTGLLHGGMQCGMMDDAIGMTCATLGLKGFLISIDLHVDYLGKVQVGENVQVTASIQREGRTVVNAHAEIRDQAGQLVATANSNLLRTSHVPEYAKAARL